MTTNLVPRAFPLKVEKALGTRLHDNSNISRCEAEANKLKKKMETIKDTIAAHDDSLFNERTGKLQTGLTCHHKFNSDTLHLISTAFKIILLN